MFKNGKLSNFLNFSKSQSDRVTKTLPLSETQRRKDAETTERKKQQKKYDARLRSRLSRPFRPSRLSRPSLLSLVPPVSL